jgi:hypothetical protein
VFKVQEYIYILRILGAESEINLKNTGIFGLNTLQSLGNFNTVCPCTQSSYVMYVSIGFNNLFHGNPILKCTEVVQPQMIDQAKYGNFSSSNPFVSAHLLVSHRLVCAYKVVVWSKHIISCSNTLLFIYTQVGSMVSNALNVIYPVTLKGQSRRFTGTMF